MTRAIPTAESMGAAIRLGAPVSELGAAVAGRRAVALVDANAVPAAARGQLPADVIDLPGGEACKRFDVALGVLARLAALEVDREAMVVGVGGGAVCDLAGFVAATYMRGIGLGLVPTTLVAQIDAAIGGKNALDVGPWKNAVGTFHFPDFILCDPGFLATLPARELRAGLAELVKAAAIGDPALFPSIEADPDALLDPGRPELLAAMRRAVAVKTAIVGRDPFERGARRLLNFGHTFGHALELAAGLGHGEAVAIGMALAARVSASLGRLRARDYRRLVDLLERLGLPTEAPRAGIGAAAAALRRDKKRTGDRIRFVVLDGIGRASIERVPIGRIEEVLS